MRPILFALLSLALVSPAVADDWGLYDNARFGYRIEVPPGFSGGGEAANGDGQVFTLAGGTQELRVFGGTALDGFEAWANGTIDAARNDGWNLTNAQSTPSWLGFGGLRNGMVVYTRAVAVCGGDQFASFELTYPDDAMAEVGQMLNRLIGSLRIISANC